MRPQKIKDQDLLNGMMAVLRTKGYVGSSLNDLASASGLQKASLYHRYPGGKKEIGLAVLHFVIEWIEEKIVAVLHDQQVRPKDRLNTALTNIDTLYDSGKSTCIIRALSVDSGLNLFGEELKDAISKWIDAFYQIGLDVGQSKVVSKKNAMQVLVEIQGSLILSKTLDDTAPFQSALKKIKSMYKVN